MASPRKNSFSLIVSTLDSSSREVIDTISGAIKLPRRLSNESEAMSAYSDPVVCKSVRRTSLGFDDYVSYPTVRHVVLDTSDRHFDTSSPGEPKQRSNSQCYCSYTKPEGSSKRNPSLDSHIKSLKLRPDEDSVSDVSSSRPETPDGKLFIIKTTDLDCPMCLQRVTNSLNLTAEQDENYNYKEPVSEVDIGHPIRPDRGVHFSKSEPHPESYEDQNQVPVADLPKLTLSKEHLKKDIDANFNPGQVFAITRPSLFGSSKKKVTFDREFDNDQVVMTFHQRRGSGYPTVPGGRNRSPSAIVSTFLGTSGFGRRFSQDLRLKGPEDEDGKGETNKVLIYQVFIPFLIAGFGNVAAGVLLEVVQHWPVYRSLPELFLLVASFLGFKGNLEMSLAARLATQAHLGQLDRPSAQVKVLIGNIALIQGQAIVVGFLAALIAIIVNVLRNAGINSSESMLLMSTSLMTATATGLIMTIMMVAVTIFARRIGANPDNVSTLTAACFGDILAVIILSYSAHNFQVMKTTAPTFETSFIFACIVIVLPIALLIARNNCYTRSILWTGWYPIIIAMCISSAGGLIFDFAVEYFDTIAVFEPIINGVGSNLVAVQASRISTYLHQRCDIGSLPDDPNTGRAYKVCQNPFKAFFGSNPNVKTARFLLLMTIPGHIIYILTMKWIQGSKVHLTGTFFFLYLTTSTIQVIIVLYLAHIVVPWLWKKGHDPDNAAVPGLMATGDFFGSALLTIAFILLYAFGDPNVTNNPVKVIH